MDERNNAAVKHIFRWDFALEVWNGKLYAASQSSGLRLPISKVQALALALFDGTRTDDEVENMWSRIFSGKGRSAVETASIRWNLLLPENCDMPHSVRKPVTLEHLSAILKNAEEDMGRPMIPENVVWRFTDQCRFCCSYCYEKDYLRKLRKPLILKEKMSVVDKLFMSGVRHVHLTGGDPFCEDDLYPILTELLKRNIRVSVLTKSRINVDAIRKMETNNLSLGFSIDSADSVIAGKLTGEKDFLQGVQKTMRLLKLNGIKFFAAYTLTQMNYYDFDKDMQWLLDQGTDRVEVTRYQETGRKQSDRELSITDSMWDEVKKKNARGVRFLDDKPAQCHSGRQSMTIDADGTVIFCDVFPDAGRFENIRQSSLSELWDQYSYNCFCRERGGKCYRCEKIFY